LHITTIHPERRSYEMRKKNISIALQGSALGGVGNAAAGNVTQVGLRDYHYGVAPQGILALSLIMGDRAMIDLTGRAIICPVSVTMTRVEMSISTA
jgi:hypothetical protein